MTFKVQDQPCDTCIYRKDQAYDLPNLEAQIKDAHGFFNSHRVCHHSNDACCRGFWNAHKNEFPLGQIAQRLNMVEFVHDDLNPFETVGE